MGYNVFFDIQDKFFTEFTHNSSLFNSESHGIFSFWLSLNSSFYFEVLVQIRYLKIIYGRFNFRFFSEIFIVSLTLTAYFSP